MKLKTCVTPEGKFVYGIHKPYFTMSNLREKNHLQPLGYNANGKPVMNHSNFPENDIEETNADIIYEVPNPFPFRGTTYIASNWAEAKRKNPDAINLPKPSEMSFSQTLLNSLGTTVDLNRVLESLPQQVLITIASESTDPEELERIARMCCTFISATSPDNQDGLLFEKTSNGKNQPEIKNHELFETIVNNPFLPENIRKIMVLRPGIQGTSEIVAEYTDTSKNVHIYEYLRRNSYIPWGHFAANMADDAIRYDLGELSASDIKGLRHLYYQRTYARVAEMLGIKSLEKRKQAGEEELELLRQRICKKIGDVGPAPLFYNATLWGWNYGFNYTSAGYNLHGSHQQIHQQYALIPKTIEALSGFEETSSTTKRMETYGCGDQIYAFIQNYRKETGHYFFNDYMEAIVNNQRMDCQVNGKNSLIVYEDTNILLFVPKAQTSQWELNLITKEPFSTILETDIDVRESLDTAMLYAMKSLSSLGARMISVIEFSGRFGVSDERQHLLYAFLPKIPYSMGAFTEAQQRFINGHYPEDFAYVCKEALKTA